MDGIQVFKQHAENIQAHFPDLIYGLDEGGVPFVHGKIILKDTNNEYIDHYEIMIKPTSNYPYRFPFVFETGNRIPINFDWHVFEQDGHCCIKAQPEEIILCKNGINLLWFIEDQLLPYFFNQKHRELHGYFLKERSHGNDGNIDYFREIFGTQDLNVILKGLAKIRNRKLPSRVEMCFCGSGLKYRKCHREALKILEVFTDEELDHFGKMVLTFGILN
jgi:hypothetical protein